ncbi:hypothetical protein GCM10010215_47920 [Streptomyces virginiae]|uniref:Uncharacterized protein n=1 Tax=Streptomyces virginiae TaxID=1961 RepID=A0ABQ3NXK3_STRVG|nr:hypothetical protein GCM10010215_47920 [Streptomyces virginiae]GHI17500.1 hypothetical protein Scinn_69630 [Streptomyces virginiae]GLV95591.1 hypothetical protein Slala04_70440 [Streptomyces lavendulae subsp. lavendulae]
MATLPKVVYDSTIPGNEGCGRGIPDGRGYGETATGAGPRPCGGRARAEAAPGGTGRAAAITGAAAVRRERPRRW